MLKDKFPRVFRVGEIVEQIFERSAILSNIFDKVEKADDELDRKHRVDYILIKDGKEYLVDVKGRRKLTRCGQHHAVIIEVRNKAGDKVYAKKFTHFAIEDPFWSKFYIVDKEQVYKLIKECIAKYGDEIKTKPDYFRLYQRDNDEAIVYIMPEPFFFRSIKPQFIIEIPKAEVADLFQERWKLERKIRERCKMFKYVRRRKKRT